MKITLTKRIENHGKSVTKEISLECADDADIFAIEDAILNALDNGAWATKEAVRDSAREAQERAVS